MIRPEDWPTIKGEVPGLAQERLSELYGAQIPRDGELFAVGRLAFEALYATLDARYGGRQVAEDVAPALFANHILRERAILVRVKGAYVPVAHIGPDGFRLLTLEESTDSIKGQDRQVPPPGRGFVARGVGEAIGHLAADAGSFALRVVRHPAAQGAVAVGVTVMTAVSIYDFIKKRFFS